MPNPSGKNQIPGGKKELPYGGVKQAQQLAREAPMSGAPTAALNAPKRLQRQAARGKKGTQEPKVLERPKDAFDPTSAPPPETTEPDHDVAAVWREIAAIPGISPLAAEMAARAASVRR